MRTKNFLFTALAMTAFAFTGCNDDDDDNYMPDELIVNAFSSKYPNAERIAWELKHDHYVADFYLDGIEREAWINTKGEWVMTESDVRFVNLPSAIQTEFQKSEYKDWKIEDVDLLERVEMDPVYVIEVEKGKQEIDLYYAEDGILIKAVEDTDDDNEHTPTTLPEAVKETINTRYPGHDLEIDTEKGIMEIDIRHERISKEVYFNDQNEWLYTSWDVKRADVPVVVLNTITSNYPSHEIDDIEYEERASGVNVYVFELEENDRETRVTVDTEGNVIK